MLQARPRGHQDWYSPIRDIIHLYPDLLRAAAIGLAEDELRKDPWIKKYTDYHNITEEQLGQAMVCFVKFMNLTNDASVPSVEAALTRCGFFKLPKAAQLIVTSKVGQAATGAYWHYIRDSIASGENQTDNVGDVGEYVSKVMIKHCV